MDIALFAALSRARVVSATASASGFRPTQRKHTGNCVKEQAQSSVDEIVNMLRVKKRINNATVLLLGARAGALFRSEQFFTYLRDFSQGNMSSLPRAAQFSHYFSILTSDRFSETDIHGIFRNSFRESEVTEVDPWLAKLVKEEFFSDILSTNFDDLLELSFHEVEMREQRDFEVLFSYRDLSCAERILTRIIKVFGDFSSRKYDLKRSINHSEQEHFYALQRILAKDLLLIGVDPKWDKHILDAIPTETPAGTMKPGSLWLVSEEALSQEEPIANLLRQRAPNSRTIVSRVFIKALHDRFCEEDAPLNYQVARDIKNQLLDISNQLLTISSQIHAQQDNHRLILDEIKSIGKASPQS